MQRAGHNLNESMYSRLGKAISLENRLVSRKSPSRHRGPRRHPRSASQAGANLRPKPALHIADPYSPDPPRLEPKSGLSSSFAAVDRNHTLVHYQSVY